jgi:hypothetical protein
MVRLNSQKVCRMKTLLLLLKRIFYQTYVPLKKVFLQRGKAVLKAFLSRSRTGVEAIFDPEGAARRGLERGEDIGQRFAPGASLQRVKDVYAERGLLPAAGEAISQIPSALAEQAPNIAASIASAKLGAMAVLLYSPVLVPLLVVLVVRWLRLCFSCLVQTLSVKLKKADRYFSWSCVGCSRSRCCT